MARAFEDAVRDLQSPLRAVERLSRATAPEGEALAFVHRRIAGAVHECGSRIEAMPFESDDPETTARLARSERLLPEMTRVGGSRSRRGGRGCAVGRDRGRVGFLELCGARYPSGWMKLKILLCVLCGAVLLVGIGVIGWTAIDLPPPKLVVRYGLPPAGGPTGRKVTIEGVTFIELAAGYFRYGPMWDWDRGDLPGRLCAHLKLPWGKRPELFPEDPQPQWMVISRPYFLAETEITNRQYRRFDPEHGRCDLKDDWFPVETVSIAEAWAYCHWLSMRGGLPVRLPTEPEWENACRAGAGDEYGSRATGPVSWGGWGGTEWGPSFSAVDVKVDQVNAWGFRGLPGNVREWCAGSRGTRSASCVHRGLSFDGSRLVIEYGGRLSSDGRRSGMVGFRAAIGPSDP
jgi:formylglycine-generating enzyme required for sulfatase activity